MATKNVNGNIPINARINIKYTQNKKPKISFSYPSKKNQVRGSMLFDWRLFLLISSILITFKSYGDIKVTGDFLLYKPFAYILFLIFIYYVFGFLTYYIPPIRKTLEKLYPKYQAVTSLKKIAVFKPKDVKVNEDGIYCELPVFNNVVCDFKCVGEFSDYLKEIDIREHKFVYFHKERIRVGKKRKRVHKVNEWLWYARWYFNKKPEKGNMEVIFK